MKAPPTWDSNQIKNYLLDESRKVNEVIPLKSKTGNSHSYLVTVPVDQEINDTKNETSINNSRIK